MSPVDFPERRNEAKVVRSPNRANHVVANDADRI